MCRGQPVEQRRLARIGVADQRHHRVGHAFAGLPVQAAGALHVLQVAFQTDDPLVDPSPVEFQLRFAGATEEPGTAALALEMRPGPHQPRTLVVQRSEVDLEAALTRSRASTENLQDQAGPVDDLAVPGLFEVALLDRRQCRIDDRDPDLMLFDRRLQLGDDALAEEGGRIDA